MNDLAISCTPSACDAPLSIGQMLACGVAFNLIPVPRA